MISILLSTQNAVVPQSRKCHVIGIESHLVLDRGTRRGLLLDWYIGSQKLREILMLLCCITLSSSREYNASSRSGRKISGAVAGEAYAKVIYQVPVTNLILRITFICLSFSSPPLHPCRFICPSFCRVFIVRFCLAVMASTPIIINTPKSEALNF